MNTLHILSGGAAQGLVRRMEPVISERTGHALQAQFGAVGAMQEQLLAGAACDVLILSRTLIAGLEARGLVLAGSARDLGSVATGVAFPDGAPPADVASRDTLAASLRAARGIYFPDAAKATAGIHFMKVLVELQLAEELAPRLRQYPNGVEAMRAMAAATAAGEDGLMGCTQVTEILFTPGVRLAAHLPAGLELNTIYTAAVVAHSARIDAATALIDILTGAQAAQARQATGFG